MADKMEGVVASNPGAGETARYGVAIETIYVNNLEERMKIETLKEGLTATFKHYGPILDIVAKRSKMRKGQAFIVFDSHEKAVQALEMDGFELYGKNMRVRLAHSHSDATVERKATTMLEEHKRRRLMNKDLKQAEEDAKAAADPAPNNAAARNPKMGLVPEQYLRPNKVLYLQNIPADVDEDDLTSIFDKFAGFKEVRYVTLKGVTVAFAEFENEQQAVIAKEACSKTLVGSEGVALKVTYQRV